jgi:hypothetical protein
VPADQVLENHNAGESVEDIAYNFDLKPDDIRFVLIYAALSANRRKAGVSERGSRVLDGCAVIAPAYMGRKRIFQMLSLQLRRFSSLAAVLLPA